MIRTQSNDYTVDSYLYFNKNDKFDNNCMCIKACIKIYVRNTGTEIKRLF